MKITRNKLRQIIKEEADRSSDLFNITKEFIINAKGGWSPTYLTLAYDLLKSDGIQDAYDRGGAEAVMVLLNQRFEDLEG